MSRTSHSETYYGARLQPALTLASMAGTALLISGVQTRLTILETALCQVGWQVAAFLNPQEALGSLKSTPYEAAFCDEQVRGASATGLLVGLRRLRPGLPVYVFSNADDPHRFRSSGEPTALLHFPPVAGQIPAPLGTRSEVALGVVETPLAGNTSLLALPDLVEMMGLSGQQGVVELEFGKQGFIVVNKTRLEHAVYFSGDAPRSGLQALAHLIELENVDFRVTDYQVPARLSINLPISSAMTEAARLADEASRFKTLLGELRERCPAVVAAAIGYATATAPTDGAGDKARLFTLATALLACNRTVLGEKLKRCCSTPARTALCSPLSAARCSSPKRRARPKPSSTAPSKKRSRRAWSGSRRSAPCLNGPRPNSPGLNRSRPNQKQSPPKDGSGAHDALLNSA